MFKTQINQRSDKIAQSKQISLIKRIECQCERLYNDAAQTVENYSEKMYLNLDTIDNKQPVVIIFSANFGY